MCMKTCQPPRHVESWRPVRANRDSAEQCVNTAEEPNTPEKVSELEVLRGDFARRAQDAHADSAADGDGQTKGDAEHAAEGNPSVLTDWFV